MMSPKLRLPPSLSNYPDATWSDEEKAGWRERRERERVRLSKSEFVDFVTLAAKLSDVHPDAILKCDVELMMRAMRRQDWRDGHPKSERGRRHKHRWITVSVEALRAADLSLDAAIVKAAHAWCLSYQTIETIYKRNKLPDKKARMIREHFAGHSAEEVLEAVNQYRGAQQK